MLTTKEFHLVRRDQNSGPLNTFLSRLALDQFVDFDVIPQGNGVRALVTYYPERPIKLIGTSIIQDAWLRSVALPTDIVLAFNTEIDYDLILDNTFEWVRNDSIVGVTKSNITFDNGGRRITLPLPDLTGYLGPLTLTAKALANRAGVVPADRIQVRFNITDAKVPSTGAIAETKAYTEGSMTVKRLHAAIGTNPQELVSNFLRSSGLRHDQILSIKYIKWERSTEAFVLWQKLTHPVTTRVAPANGSSIDKQVMDAADNSVFFSFSEAVDEHTLSGADGVDRLLWDGQPLSYYTSPNEITLSKTDDIGSAWSISGYEMLATEGVHTLEMRDIRNLNGDRTDTFAYYSWVVVPVPVIHADEIIGGGGSGMTTCYTDSLPVDGTTDAFTLSGEPEACSTHVYVNGLWCDPSEHTIVGDQITFVTPPPADFDVWVQYYIKEVTP